MLPPGARQGYGFGIRSLGYGRKGLVTVNGLRLASGGYLLLASGGALLLAGG